MEIFEKIIGLSSKKGMEVFDRGKKTPLRAYFRNKIFCCHFAYENTEDIPKIFSIDYRNLGAVNYKVEIIDNTHSIYTPTIVLGRILNTGEKMKIVIYHGGNKGEYSVGDILIVKGELIENNLGKFLNAKNVEKLKD